MNEQLLCGSFIDVDSLDRIFPGTSVLLLQVEKVLQGDIYESADPYLKDDRKAKDSLRGQAAITCERLGRYRQPLGWTAIYLQNVVQGTTSLEKDGTLPTVSGSTIGRRSSLERGTKLDSFRKVKDVPSEPVISTGSNMTLDNFRTLTIVVNHLFRQEVDKVKDEDLFKFLQEFRRPAGSGWSDSTDISPSSSEFDRAPSSSNSPPSTVTNFTLDSLSLTINLFQPHWEND